MFESKTKNYSYNVFYKQGIVSTNNSSLALNLQHYLISDVVCPFVGSIKGNSFFISENSISSMPITFKNWFLPRRGRKSVLLSSWVYISCVVTTRNRGMMWKRLSIELAFHFRKFAGRSYHRYTRIALIINSNSYSFNTCMSNTSVNVHWFHWTFY